MRFNTYFSGLAILSFAFFPGCVSESLPPPVVTSVCLSENVLVCIDMAYAGSTQEVTLRGENFQPSLIVDLETKGSPIPAEQFAVKIGQTSLLDLALRMDVVHEELVLSGRLPGSTPVGLHDVELVTPGGQSAQLDAAFRIVEPLKLAATIEDARIPEGHTAELEVTLKNLGPARIEEVEINLAQSGTGRCAWTTVPEPFSIESSETITRRIALLAESPGDLTLSIDAAGLVNDVVPAGATQTALVGLKVLSAATLEGVASIVPDTIREGQIFELAVQVSNTGDTPVLGAELLPPTFLGDGGVEMNLPLPNSINIPGGSSRWLRWKGVAIEAGPVSVQARLSGMEAVSGRLMGPVLVEPVSLVIQ